MTVSVNLICPYCKKDAKWCENKEIYGKNYGRSYMCWHCADCNAYVGCHNNTTDPLGTMADKETRKWRQKAHQVLDPIWRNHRMKRGDVYAILQNHFGFPVHVAQSDIEMCKKIIKICKKKALGKRKIK